MVQVNANLDLKTFDVLDTGRLNDTLENLCEDQVYVTFIARDRDFVDKVKRIKGETFLWVVLPYKEVLSTNNIELLAYRHLYQHLDKLKWLDKEKMKQKLSKIITSLENSSLV